MRSPPAPRRPDVLGVHSLDHFAVQVPSLAAAQAFYGAFGLDVRGLGDGLGLYTHAAPHCWARLTEGPAKITGHVSFGAFPDDLDAFRRHLDANGVQRCDPPSGVEGEGLWLRDPHGLLVEVRGAERTSPDAPAPEAPAPEGRLRKAPMRGDTAPVRPRRLSHALFFTPDIERTIAFYSQVLGLRLSDHPGPVAFLHGAHGSEHHLIAFAESSKGVGYHHSAWEMGSVTELGLGAMQMADKGYRDGWGLGRHVLGSNYFHYVRDPWGSYAEYSFDIDYIPAGIDWKASRPPPENSLYLWGPPPPEDFVVNYEGVGAGDLAR
jgi:catechol 2,3-dioxygenase